jgi:hypothetical protein
MTEKNMLAYFKTPEEAEKVGNQLASMGVTEYKIDRISKYPGDGIEEFTNPITSKISSLADLTQDTDISGRNAGILAAADVDASGMSDGGQEITGRDMLLTAVIDESLYEQALKVVENAGGKI